MTYPDYRPQSYWPQAPAPGYVPPPRKSTDAFWLLGSLSVILASFVFMLLVVSALMPTPRDTKFDYSLSYQYGTSQVGPYAAAVYWGSTLDACQNSISVNKPNVRPAWWDEPAVLSGCVDYVHEHGGAYR
ncbi:hypothetical protein [Mycobacterium sp.]|uniref:hypothetical protein n=1 Tax=Mycobacterium sp. TaxID=1785 RepID=UPI003F9E906C